MFDCIYKIIDVTGDEPVEMKGFVPARSVVIQVAIPKFPAGDFQVPCFNHWTRKPSTDLKTSLNNALREYDVAV
jgi:2,3,4,5-tetrahydropyridine-2-carboxylate N-succinyltransferase